MDLSWGAKAPAPNVAPHHDRCIALYLLTAMIAIAVPFKVEREERARAPQCAATGNECMAGDDDIVVGRHK